MCYAYHPGDSLFEFLQQSDILTMSFWQNVQTGAGMGAAFIWVTLAFLVLALLLFAMVQPARMRVRTSVLLFALSFCGLL